MRSRSDQSCTSIIVAAELWYGLKKQPSDRRSDLVRQILGALPIAAWEHPAELHYAEIRSQLERAGTPIGGNDLWIAAHARALGLTLVTANEREFRRVESLKVENWLD